MVEEWKGTEWNMGEGWRGTEWSIAGVWIGIEGWIGKGAWTGKGEWIGIGGWSGKGKDTGAGQGKDGIGHGQGRLVSLFLYLSKLVVPKLYIYLKPRITLVINFAVMWSSCVKLFLKKKELKTSKLMAEI